MPRITMRALLLSSLEGADGLAIAEVPVPGGPDDVFIEVHAAGVGCPAPDRAQ